MPAAVIGGIIAGGASLGAAAISSHAAGKAADQQVASGDKALALQRDIYNQQQANEAPFRNTGAQAITTLGGLLGLPTGGGGGGSTGQLPSANTLGTMDPAISPAQANFSNYSPGGGYVGKNVSMSEQMSNPYVNVDASGYTAAQHGASTPSSPTVTVRAPNGTSYQVPADKVGEAQQNGGVVIGRT